jgi:hypothetical protein
MLELRPNCELCDCDLPPDDSRARICTYECTFCVECVDNVLSNVCPNCGGDFVPRPIRPLQARHAGVSRLDQPPSAKRRYTKYTKAELIAFAALYKDIAPTDR